MPKEARVPKRVKNGSDKPKETSPKWEPFLTYFPTCRAQFFHQLFGPFLTRPVDHFWRPGSPKWGPFWDVFGDFLGLGWKSAKRIPAAAGAVFSRVHGVKFGTFLATFSRTFSKAAFRRLLDQFFVSTLGAKLGPNFKLIC